MVAIYLADSVEHLLECEDQGTVESGHRVSRGLLLGGSRGGGRGGGGREGSAGVCEEVVELQAIGQPEHCRFEQWEQVFAVGHWT